MKKHTGLWLVFTVALALLVSACGTKQSSASGKDAKVKVGILQLMDQSALDQARKGFIAELKKGRLHPGQESDDRLRQRPKRSSQSEEYEREAG